MNPLAGSFDTKNHINNNTSIYYIPFFHPTTIHNQSTILLQWQGFLQYICISPFMSWSNKDSIICPPTKNHKPPFSLVLLYSPHLTPHSASLYIKQYPPTPPLNMQSALVHTPLLVLVMGVPAVYVGSEAIVIWVASNGD